MSISYKRSNLKVDEELGLQLKDFRNQYQVKAKDVAAHMNKSAAYISKLEKGEIKQIDKDEFIKMVCYISSSDNGYQLFCQRIIALMDSEALDNSVIVSNFDWIDRVLPIPEEYCDYVQKKIKECNIQIKELVEYINRNDDLDESFWKEQKFDFLTVEKNVWIPYYEADSNFVRRACIVIEISENEIIDIIEHKIQKTSYLFLYVILYHIYKLLELNKHATINDGTRINIKRKTVNKLNQYKIYTLAGKANAVSSLNSEDEIGKVLNSFDIKNKQLLIELMEAISFLSEQDVEYTNNKLENVIRNFKINPSFALAYMAIPLDKFQKMSVKMKKDFLDGVGELIEKTIHSENVEIEKY